jgi:glucose-1-phosphate thymidylyltransferase
MGASWLPWGRYFVKKPSMIYGAIPAGGRGSRLQPIGFSKELAPVGRRAVIEHLIERMVLAGIDKIFINTTEDKTDLIVYLASKSPYSKNCIFLVRERRGLLDGIVQPAQFLKADDELYFGLPDTIWYPKDCYKTLTGHPGSLVLGLFDTGSPHRFDAVTTDASDRIQLIEVKVPNPQSKWTWGIGKIRISEVPRLLSPKKMKQITENGPLCGLVLNAYAQRYPAYGLRFANSSYLDIGSREDYAQAEAFVKRYEHSTCIGSAGTGL